MYKIFDKHQQNWVEILFDILYAFLHFLFAKLYMYHCAHQGSAKEVTPHEGRLLPTTGNSKGLQCCQGVLLNVCLSQAPFGPVGGTNLTEAFTTGPAMLASVQTGNTLSTPVMSQTGQPTSLPDTAAPGPFTMLVEKPKKLPKKNPDLFKTGTISGRYHEWIGDGQCSGIKSQLVPQKNGEGRMRLPRTGHSEEAVNNLRKNRDLPEAIEQLVEQGLSSKAAIALVTIVLKDFGLTTKTGREKPIVKQSSAFFILRSTPADKIGTRLLLRTGRPVMEFKKVYDEEVTLALNNLKHQAL